MTTPKVAFALGGLAGNNAHGAGFLQAALKRGIDPSIISCTSGQIYWTYRYLQARRDPGGDLRRILEHDVEELSLTHNTNLDTAILAVWGKPGVFRPAYAEYIQDLCRNTLDACLKIAGSGRNTFFLQELLRTIPARTLVPLFPDTLFEGICAEFRRSPIGIVFNSYHPIEGCEYVHLNDAARALMAEHSHSGGKKYEPGQPDTYRDRVYYQDVTAESVRDGLWIYKYGFEKASGFLDGAYFRQVILGELTSADHIFVVRPLSHRWVGALPTSYIETEDLKTEVAFDGAYAGERNQINLINKLLGEGKMVKGKYHTVALHEVEINVQRGFFDYLYEKLDVFDHAVAEATKQFAEVISA